MHSSTSIPHSSPAPDYSQNTELSQRSGEMIESAKNLWHQIIRLGRFELARARRQLVKNAALAAFLILLGALFIGWISLAIAFWIVDTGSWMAAAWASAGFTLLVGAGIFFFFVHLPKKRKITSVRPQLLLHMQVDHARNEFMDASRELKTVAIEKARPRVFLREAFERHPVPALTGALALGLWIGFHKERAGSPRSS